MTTESEARGLIMWAMLNFLCVAVATQSKTAEDPQYQWFSGSYCAYA